MVNSDETVRKVISEIVKNHWPKVDTIERSDNNHNNQFFDDEWLHPGWGSDTLKHMIDDIVSVIASMVADNIKKSDVL